MLEDARAVVVAVSGGADSVALLDMLVRVASKTALRIHVAHLNHMLRGDDSNADAEFVRALAESLSLSMTIQAMDVRREAAASGRSIEEAARELRYGFLLTTAHEMGADRIATGHTMNDQAETFLMRLARGAGSRGLASMRAVTKAHEFGENLKSQIAARASGSSAITNLKSSHPLLVRPLLRITREEIEGYCRERGLAFRTDASNESMDYTRNRVRHEVIAALKRVNPRVVEHISSAASLIASDQEALDRLARSLLDLAEQPQNASSSAYKVARFTEQPEAVCRRMIIEAIRRKRSSAAIGRAEIESKHVTAVKGLLDEHRSGARIDLPGGLEAWREFDLLVFKPRAPVEEADSVRALGADCSRFEAGGIEVGIERGRPGHLREVIVAEARREAARSGRDWMIAVLDDRALPDVLVVRGRKKGERAHVCGQRKIIKLKNLMIDHKIPSSRRADWPIVATPEGRYIWSPGLPPAVEFAARDETQTLAILRASGV
ncbi:MAG TPA: tRNA lysidine(34) synthetase TilS [Blastocatellia bacterium]|nr:tRNA lysidine(34) synthetase TilS [Blastocatellia bacterium]